MSLFDGPLQKAESLVPWLLVVFKVSVLTKEVLGKSLALATRAFGARRTVGIGAFGDTTQGCVAEGVVDVGLIIDEGSCAAMFTIGRLGNVNSCLMLGNVVDGDIHGEFGFLLSHVQLLWDKRMLVIVHVSSLLAQPSWIADRR